MHLNGSDVHNSLPEFTFHAILEQEVLDQFEKLEMTSIHACEGVEAHCYIEQ